MTETTDQIAELDTFAPGMLDKETELAALAHALEFASGFSLLFAQCNQSPQRRQLMAELRQRLPQFTVQEIILNEPVNHLLDALRERLDSPLPNAVFVSGLEHSLPSIAEAVTTSFIANLNASRNSFPQTLPRPIVLWVPEYVLTAIAQGAPDFFSIRSGIYSFVATLEGLTEFAQTLSAGKHWQAQNLPLSEKQDRIAAIQQLLAEYKTLPIERRDRRAELRLIDRLGVLFYSQGNYAEALRQFQGELNLSKELSDFEGVARSLHRIGNLHFLRGENNEAIQHYEQSLRIFEELGDDSGVAGSLGQIGLLYKDQGKYEQALQRYQQALQIYEELGDRAGVSISLHNIGVLRQARGEYDEALQLYQQAMRIAEELDDRAGVASSLHQLGRLHQLRGEYDQALKHYEQSQRIKEELGSRTGVAISLSQIGKLYLENGQHVKAFPLLLNSLDAFSQLQSPYAKTAMSNLRSLRTQWGERAFDAAWREAKGEEVPEWLKKTNALAQ